MRNFLKLAGVALLVLIAVVAVRTIMFAETNVAQVERLTVDVDEARIVQHMSQAIAFKTISTGNSDTQSYSEFARFKEWLQKSYPEVVAGLKLEVIADHTMLFQWLGANSELKPILLTAHYDVVPVVPGTEKDWKHAPFSGAVADGYVWGRGAMDDKSAIVVMLEATTQLLKEGFRPERTIYFSFGHDEEIGGQEGANGVVEYLKQQAVQLAWSLDEGSFISTGMFPGVAKPVASINVAEKGSVTFDLIANGPGGHSSIPGPEVAIDILAKALLKVRNTPVPGELEGLSAEMIDGIARNGPLALRVLAANKWLFGGLLEDQLSASNMGNAMIRTTTAPTMLSAGVKSNVISPTATATINFRLHPRDTPEGVKAHLQSLIDDQRVEVRIQGDGMYALASEVSSRDNDAYKVIAKIARQVFGDIVVVPGLTVAGTDTKHYSKVADNSYRFQYMVVSPEEISGFHGTNERVRIDNLVKATSAYYLLMKESAGR